MDLQSQPRFALGRPVQAVSQSASRCLLLFLGWACSFPIALGPQGFAAGDSTASMDRENDRTEMSLDGSWKFFPAFEELAGNQAFLAPHLSATTDSTSENKDRHHGWIEPGFDDSGWWEIKVPGSWNTQFEDLWSYEGQGWYRKVVSIPMEWAGKKVFFQSDGANYRTLLYVNGRRVGVHEGGHTAFSFSIENELLFGETNTLAIVVENESRLDRVPMERHDWWNHGGLYRPVRLQATDPVFVETWFLDSRVGQGTAEVVLAATLSNQTTEPQVVEVMAHLSDDQDKPCGTAQVRAAVDPGRCCVSLHLPVENPNLWRPENPYLYTLRLSAKTPAPHPFQDSQSCRIGIRSIRVEDSLLLLNGKPLLIKGVNRYENYPGTGMTSTAESLEEDVALIKSLGANAVRCHYPYAQGTYDRLDEAGILAICEVPLYQWGRPGHSEKNLEAAKHQLAEIIQTLGNHPSVILWSVSNENRTRPREEGEEHRILSEMVARGNLELIDLAHHLDSTRPVVAPSNRWPNDPLFEKTDLLSVNVYLGAETPHVDSLPEMMATMHQRMEELREIYPAKPILVTEYGSWALRGLKTEYFPGEGYQAALLTEYWRSFLREPHFVGAFIWCFADSDVHRKFTTLYEMRCAYGLYDLHRRPKQSARAMADLWNGD